MKDAVELLKDSPRAAASTSRRSKDGADDRGLHLGHPPREKLSLRDGEASMERERKSKRTARQGEREKLWFV